MCNLQVILALLIAAVASSIDSVSIGQERDKATIPVSMRIDASKSLDEFVEISRFFGADEPNYAYMKDGEKLLSKLGELHDEGPYFRTHNLMTSGPGAPALKWGSTNLYTEDPDGHPKYDFEIVDLIFDTYLERGVRPYVQLGFMPEALSTSPEPYRHEWRPGMAYGKIFTGWAYPPKDYHKWGELCYQWAKHCVDRYGMKEVERWYWQTWNEPNSGYWQGTDEEFHKLHDYAIAGVRRAIPKARVGGADFAGNGGGVARRFFEHCISGTNYVTGRTGTDLDFVSFHAKGQPQWKGNYIQMGISSQLKVINGGFEIIASYPELKNKPIVIGESDPEGCAACQGDRFSYRNGTVYSSYTAASFARKHELAARHGVDLQGALTWAFTFEDQPYFAGFRQLASNNIDLPVLNVFRMMSKMHGDRLAVQSDGAIALDDIMHAGVRGDRPDVAGIASVNEHQLEVMCWNYHDNDVPGPAAAIEMVFDNLPADAKTVKIEHYRVDDTHSNSYAEWLRMGSPGAPNAKEYEQLVQASQLTMIEEPKMVSVVDGALTESFLLPRQGVSLIVIQWDDT